MTIASDYQMEFGGLLVGADTDYRITQVSGLADYPEVQTADQGRLRRHGLLPGDDFTGGRTITVNVVVRGDSSASTLTELMAALKTALPIGDPEGELSLQFPGIADGTTVTVNARPRRMSAPLDTRWKFSAPEVVLEFFATDPRIYGPQQTGSDSLPVASGGATFSLTFDLTFGVAGTPSAITATNDGTFSTPPTFTFTGPFTNVSVHHEETDRTLAFEIDVAAGDYLLVNADDRTVLLNGTQNRYYTLETGSAWFDLLPGDNNLTFSTDVNATGTVSVAWRDAWI